MLQFLAKLPIPEIQPASMEFIVAHTQLRRMKSNSLLIGPGKVCDSVFLVVEGGFVCRYIDPEQETGKTINFYLNDVHPFMACIDSYFTQTPTQCELRAISDAAVIQIKKKDLDTLLEMDASLRQFYQELVVTALREENDLKLKIIAYPSEQLYRYFMEYFPSVIQRVPSKYIAELMGISPEWLSKLKRPK